MKEENSDKDKGLPESFEEIHSVGEPKNENGSAEDDPTAPNSEASEAAQEDRNDDEEVTQLEVPAFDVKSAAEKSESAEAETTNELGIDLLEEPPLPEPPKEESSAKSPALSKLRIQSDDVEHPAAGVLHEEIEMPEIGPAPEVDSAPGPAKAKTPPWLIFYNERCPYSYEEGQVLQKLSGGRAECRPWRDAHTFSHLHSADRSKDYREKRVCLVSPGANVFTGAEARARAAFLRPLFGKLSSLYEVRLLRPFFHLLYGPRPQGVRGASGPLDGVPAGEFAALGKLRDLSKSSYGTSTHLFVHLLALIQIVAFTSLLVQVTHLIGENGLVPATAKLQRLQETAQTRMRNDGAAETVIENNWQWQAFMMAPTLFHWVEASDANLQLCCALGAWLSVLTLLRIFPRTVLFVQLVFYLSLATISSPFLNFQWDNLILETTCLALLLPMAGTILLGKNRVASPMANPNRATVFVMQWMLFRLYFESGFAKIMGGVRGGWLDLTAMNAYYDTVPLPTPLTRTFHNLPVIFHEWETLMTLVLEFLLPVFIFAGRGFRRGLFFIFTGMQLTIMLTGNYAFFNWISLILGLFLVDNHDWLLVRKWAHKYTRFAWKRPIPRDVRYVTPGWRQTVAGAISGVCVIALTVASLNSFFQLMLDRSPHQLLLVNGQKLTGQSLLENDEFVIFQERNGTRNRYPRAEVVRIEKGLLDQMQKFMSYYQPYRVVNVYHLFANMTRERVMPEIQGSMDLNDWKPYRFHYAPGDPAKTPGFVAPHQPRFDFQLWFLAFAKSGWKNNVPQSRKQHDYHFWYETRKQFPGGGEYFMNLLEKLQKAPDQVSYFFSEMPFGSKPPKYLRLVFYDYHMSDDETFARTGAYWTRSKPMVDEAVIVLDER
ncbi:MAG: lipase maturation factor family protein [Planctomycetota bacterium]|nr:lipase maturation factor family protein [Planctomycetota bacterium]